ncbi:unnamed protein product [Didymodactylos carnosus]|uniref:Peptide deformylase n=1 Tax=Didymodactylos carnosus TaxID=1234261 RepID=A0A8S2FQF3_9BILA|nr:unnamed protein product [Didymodactylos carnosus]CAF4316865.1 unnamed protein product [Didymodactylos carnosus]
MVAYIDVSFEGEEKQYGIRPGIAIAAPQVGLGVSLIYLNFVDEDDTHHQYFLANPKIITESNERSYLPAGEGCLSVKQEHPGIVPRARFVTVSATIYPTQEKIEIKAGGLLSICLQHEIDHLHGRLFYDRINPFSPDNIEKDWHQVER